MDGLKKDSSAYTLFLMLWSMLSEKRKRQFWLILILMVCSSAAELVSIGAIIPFITALSHPETFLNFNGLKPFLLFFNIIHPDQIVILIAVGFCLLAIVASLLRIFLLWGTTKIAFSVGADLSLEMYKRTLFQSYEVHCSRNSSALISSIVTKSKEIVFGVMYPSLILLSATIILILLSSILALVQPLVTFIILFIFGSIYYFVIIATRNKLMHDGEIIASQTTKVIQILQEGIGGIRDILLDGNQDAYLKKYQSTDLPLRRALANTTYISQSPRYVLEGLSLIAMAIAALVINKNAGGLLSALPMLGFLALCAQRILPIIQQGYQSLTIIRSNFSTLIDVLDLLTQKLPISNSALRHRIPFLRAITLKKISFRYANNSSWVLKDINLTINKGDKIGFIGKTGAGKSTLIDIIMALLTPTEGKLLIDDVAISDTNHLDWQAQLAHVPQSIFLADCSIEENVAFGVPIEKIDSAKVQRVASIAQIAEDIESWPLKYKTIIGENGIKLSGGQKQRLGLARALYKEASVIILDEATSALDESTERAVINSISNLNDNLTVIMIAHRISTLKKCTRIFEITKKGGLYEVSYDQILRESNQNGLSP